MFYNSCNQERVVFNIVRSNSGNRFVLRVFAPQRNVLELPMSLHNHPFPMLGNVLLVPMISMCMDNDPENLGFYLFSLQPGMEESKNQLFRYLQKNGIDDTEIDYMFGDNLVYVDQDVEEDAV